MSIWNYVATAHKPTTVSHSCAGNFTGPHDVNLIVAKSTRIQIHSLCTNDGLQQILEAPIYGQIAALELFRPNGQQQDYLFISTEEYKFCVLQWDSESGQFITRAKGDVTDPIYRPAENGRIIGIIDPDCRAIGFHAYEGLFKVIALDDNGQPRDSFVILYDENIVVLDIKFLYGCLEPTIAVLYIQPGLSLPNDIDELHVKTYEVDFNRKKFNNGPWSWAKLDYSRAGILIPVAMPLGGVIIIAQRKIVYCNESVSTAISKSMTITKAYGRVDGCRYLLGDDTGKLYLLSIIHEDEHMATGLDLRLLGATCAAASTITYLGHGIVYVGSSYGDSQLMKLNLQTLNATSNSNVKVLETFVNIGPILDFCVVDIDKRPGAGAQIVTCSGGYNHGSLRRLRYGVGFNEKASQNFAGIKGIWSLKPSSTHDIFDHYLVVSFVCETRILSMNSENELEETEIQGFDKNAQTLFCHNAVHDQLVQITSSCVRLVSASSKMLLFQWPMSHGECSIILGTANATQVLINTEEGHLVYMEIEKESLVERKYLKIDSHVSCLDLNPSGNNPDQSEFAVVGVWKDYSIRIYSLPNLDTFKTFHFAENVPPRSVLLCRFEGTPYLLCGLGDGNLYEFKIDMSNGEKELSVMNKIPFGTKAISLTTFRYKNKTHVFVSSELPALIYGDNYKLTYMNVHFTVVNHMCSFNTIAFPDTVVIANEDSLIIGSIDDIQKPHVSSVPLGELCTRICYQEQSHTFAVCTEKKSGQFRASQKKRKRSNTYDYDQRANNFNFVRLFDDKRLENVSSYSLDGNEEACCILSCSFTNDRNFYYCVGTMYMNDDDNEPMIGRILIFLVENKQLRLVSENETKGAVFNLNSLDGKLVAGINQNIELYKWNDVSGELKCECVHDGHNVAFRAQTRGNFIVVADLLQSMYVLEYKTSRARSALRERARDKSARWMTGMTESARLMTAVEFLDDDIYLGAETNFYLFTATENCYSAEGVGKLEVEGGYHVGEFVNRFIRGSLALPHVSRSEQCSDFPTVIFGTGNGTIGVIASLAEPQYHTLEKLQTHLVKVIEGVGRLSHEDWRSFSNGMETRKAKKFLDGDFIESFLDLNRDQKEEIAIAVNVSEEELSSLVARLKGLHCIL